MLREYFPIAVFFLFLIAFPVVTLLVARLLRPHNPTRVKQAPYECGIETHDSIRHRFNVRYYVVAVVFLIFDVEVIFLLPWAVLYQKLGLFGFIEMTIFILILLVGYFYAWAKGALEWA